MATRQHHYVPRFYLARFASKPKRINVYNLRRTLAKEDVSLREQCKKPNFYGDHDTEKALSILESSAAVCIDRETSQPSKTPPKELLEFVAIQYLRTPAFAKTMDEMSKKLFGSITDRMPEEERIKAMDSLMQLDEMPVFNLTLKDEVVEDFKDLKLAVISQPEAVFITSDNPGYFYNQYCEQVQGRGKNGTRQRGLQIFMPLSPRHYLLLYDGNTYDYVKSQSTSESDIYSLNGLQVVSADANLYFADWAQLSQVETLIADMARLRISDPEVLQRFVSDDNRNGELLHSYVGAPNLGLNLSFLRIKKRALRVHIHKRPARRSVIENQYPKGHDHPFRKYPKRIAKP